MLWFKADRGAKDFWNESHKTIATQEGWEKRRPLLRTRFENYLTSHNYITCRGCHALDALARRKFGRRSRSGAERRILATVVRRCEAADGVGRDQRPGGAICRENVHYAEESLDLFAYL